MKLELFIFGITAFLIFNTYYDGKYLKVFHSWQKEIKMSTFAFIGLSLYIFLKKNPGQSQSMLSHANDIIRYMPISRSSADMLSPFLDFANKKSMFQDGDASGGNDLGGGGGGGGGYGISARKVRRRSD